MTDQAEVASHIAKRYKGSYKHQGGVIEVVSTRSAVSDAKHVQLQGVCFWSRFRHYSISSHRVYVNRHWCNGFGRECRQTLYAVIRSVGLFKVFYPFDNSKLLNVAVQHCENPQN